jgi:hypothetical protein
MSSGAEVVTFSTMLVSAELVLVVRFLQSGRGGWLVGAALANGLGWTTHNLSLLTWPAYAVLVLVHRRHLPRVGGRTLAAIAGAWLVGALPLLVLAVREYAVMGDAWATLRSLFVGVYAEHVFHHRVDPSLGLRVAAYLLWNFPTPLVLLAPWGWVALRRSSTGEQRTVASGVWLYLTVAAAMYTLFGARYKVSDQYTFLVHAYLFLATFTALGVERWCARFPSKRTDVLAILLSVLAPTLYVVAPKVARRVDRSQAWLPAREIPYRDPYAWFLRPWRAGDDGAEQFAHEVLKTLPPDAVFFADSTSRRPIDYVQAADGLRHDVQIIGSKWRPREERAPIDPASLDSYAARGVLYCLSNEPGYMLSVLRDPRYRMEPEGSVSRVVHTNQVP